MVTLRRKLLLDVLVLAICGAALFYLLPLVPVGLEWLSQRGYQLRNLQMLWILAAIPLVWLIAVHSLSDLPWFQRVLSALAKALLIVAVTAAAVEPVKIETKGRHVCVVYLVDVSESVEQDVLDRVQREIDEAWAKRGKNEIRVVAVSSVARVLDPRDKGARAPLVVRVGDGKRTNLAAGFRKAVSVLPDGYLHRIMVISDGLETEGNLMAEVEAARVQGVRVGVRLLESKVVRREVMVRGIDVERISVGIPFKVSAELQSTHKTKASCTLYRDDLGMVTGKKDVELKKGVTVVEFERLQVTEGGEIRFRIECKAAKGDDKLISNNTAFRSVRVDSKPKVLYVEGDYRHREHLVKALRNENLIVEAVPHYGLPSTLSELKKYDAVILSDVPAARIGRNKMAALERYVRSQGGLIVAGGQNGLGPGGYAGTVLERLLPVTFDVQRKKKSPSVALMLVIDRSGSMSGRKMELAKEAAKATANVLSGDSKIGVIAFDTRALRVVPLQSAAYKGRIQRMISSIQPGGGTEIYPALYLAYEDLQGVNAKIKHIILLSDGKAPHGRIAELVQEMRSEGITISTVGVGAYVDRDLMTSIAELGGGTPYFTNDAYSIPRIFLNETSQITRQSLVEEPLRAIVNARFLRAQILKGVDMSRAPYLLGYTVARPKPNAEVVLFMERYKEPLLVRWRQGMGKVVVFTSDVKARWSAQWIRWKQYAKFWGQVVRDVVRRQEDERYELRSRVVGDELQVELDAVEKGGRFANDLKVRVKVLPPSVVRRKKGTKIASKDVKELELRQVAPGFYTSRTKLSEFGPYKLIATSELEGKVLGRSRSDVSYAFPQEYGRFGLRRAWLNGLGRIGGIGSDPKRAALFDPGKERSISFKALWPPFLYLMAALLLFDLLLRRVRLGRAATIDWRSGKRTRKAAR